MSDEKKKRGFATLSPEKQREISSKGGRAAHEQGRAHKWDNEAAREAGRKGGVASSEKARARREGVGGPG
jgi:uncharacterized protein